MFDRVLIANRGAIACRIERTLRRLGIVSVAVYSEADRGSAHVRDADVAVLIGGGAASDSYLRADRILEAARSTGAQAIHPGYGFLSENAQFAEDCERAGFAFIGPTPEQIRDFGRKHAARALAGTNEVPLLPGSGLLRDLEEALAEAERIGYPVMLKSTAGGGGIGMQHCASPTELRSAYDNVVRLAGSHFRDSGVLLEKYVARARHIEVQLFGDGRGVVVALGERDCSIQRRNQKVIEETPAPHLDAAVRQELWAAAVRLGQAVRYRSAGTVEFILDAESVAFYFLEVNTRLQVEHGVTEAVSGIDLVEWMLRLAAGESLALERYSYQPKGAAVQARLYAEDPMRGFRPGSGLLSEVRFPDQLRVDSWIESGTEVPADYDPMLAKLIAHGATRELAVGQLDAALAATSIYGIETNRDYLRAILANTAFREGRYSTRLLDTLSFASASIEVIEPGTLSTLQDWPGRLRYWDVGVPPSGPMDALAHRLANALLGNAEDAAALELTVTGPTLRFACDAEIVLTGARMRAELDGEPIGFWSPRHVSTGSVLRIGAIEDLGQRAYLAVRGGFDVPRYLGSRATFTLGHFGGHVGRALRVGDVLRLGGATERSTTSAATLPSEQRPSYAREWELGVLYGPHAAPDFFTAEDMQRFFGSAWRVHYNSSRTGVRLIGPKPHWARPDGGEAGLHPSNIHDNAYAIGAVDFTGDMPVILGPDGPSLGGFVCPATVALSELWKLGQLKPGDLVRFRAWDAEDARERVLEQDEFIRRLRRPSASPRARAAASKATAQPALQAILWQQPATAGRPAVCYRQAGEDNILIEYGEPTLDLALRFRIQALLDALRAAPPSGVIDLTPGVRSLQVHFDCRVLARDSLLTTLRTVEQSLPSVDALEVASRIVHLPLSWDDPATREAIERYMRSVRADAPWCPSNIEFIRRINGLASIEDVQRIVFEASYLVMGLGDVYLGAPVATPLDPRHRLITTKYNPARTWTPENAVGIGGAYLCVYGMEGPGGYQFVGRTVQMWNRYRKTREFPGAERHLLRFFDQLRFYPVTAEELTRLRADFPYGKAQLRIEPTTLRLRDYRAFLATHADSIGAFRARSQAAFAAERERWRSLGEHADNHAEDANETAGERSVSLGARTAPPDARAVSSPVSGSVWQLNVGVGEYVEAGTTVATIEAMKMEIVVPAPCSGTVVEICCERAQRITAGEILLWLKASGA